MVQIKSSCRPPSFKSVSDVVECRSGGGSNNPHPHRKDGQRLLILFPEESLFFEFLFQFLKLLLKPASACLLHHRNNQLDRKSTRLNSSHVATSYAVLCLNKKTYRR